MRESLSLPATRACWVRGGRWGGDGEDEPGGAQLGDAMAERSALYFVPGSMPPHMLSRSGARQLPSPAGQHPLSAAQPACPPGPPARG